MLERCPRSIARKVNPKLHQPGNFVGNFRGDISDMLASDFLTEEQREFLRRLSHRAVQVNESGTEVVMMDRREMRSFGCLVHVARQHRLRASEKAFDRLLAEIESRRFR